MTTPAFEKTVLGKYRVSYFRCRQCNSLQTEPPYWLDEAYSDPSLALDPGAADRVLSCVVLTRAVARLLGLRHVLDFGGGAGLLCRLLRDAGLDAYSFDRYSDPVYALGFTGDPAQHFDLVTAFEVVEHFANPRHDLSLLFGGTPDVVLIMTEIFRGQGADWWYLAPEEGQHVFIYSSDGIGRIADRFGYRALMGRGFFLFMRRPVSGWRRLALRWLLRPRALILLRALMLARRGPGAERDMRLLMERAALRAQQGKP